MTNCTSYLFFKGVFSGRDRNPCLELKIVWNFAFLYFYCFLYNADRKLALLGQGAFGQVFLVQNKATQKQFAMKQTYFEQRLRPDQRAEYLILTQFTPLFTSPFIVRLFDTLFDAHYLRLFIDYCGGGSLRDRINYRKNFAKHPFNERVFFFCFDSFYVVFFCLFHRKQRWFLHNWFMD